MTVTFGVAADQSFIPLADDPCLAASDEDRCVSGRRAYESISYLIIALFTTARTTAFIPALSPPEVSTASFIFLPLDMVGGRVEQAPQAVGYMRRYRAAEIV